MRGVIIPPTVSIPSVKGATSYKVNATSVQLLDA